MLLSGCKTSVIPNSVKSIGEVAFSGCTGLTSITIPNSVKSIGYGAFSRCTGLTSITIPNSVTSIGEVAFANCTGLTSLVVDSGNTVYRSEGNCLIEKKDDMLLSGCKTSVIPNSVKSIGTWAFSGCTGLTSITIPNSVTSIGYGAFSECTNLSSVDIPSSVIVYAHAFENCKGLSTIIIPSSVLALDLDVFEGCTNLTSVISLAPTTQHFEETAFIGIAPNATLHVLPGRKAAYKKWSAYFRTIVEDAKTVIKSNSHPVRKPETASDSSNPAGNPETTVESNKPVASIAINQESLTISPSDSLTLKATIDPSNATNKKVTWSSTNPKIAEVSSDGIVTGILAGNCTIVCTAADGSGAKATCAVAVHGVPDGVQEVDLGLPSGTLWANMNVGATVPHGYGWYYAWGEVDTKTEYSLNNYKYIASTTSAPTYKKYVSKSEYGTPDNKSELEAEDDAARINWNSNWLTPTFQDFKELHEYCTIKWTTQNGVNGKLYTGPNGNSIFLPAAGYKAGTKDQYQGEYLLYWVRGSNPSDNRSADRYNQDANETNTLTLSARFCGRTVRPISVNKAIRVTDLSVGTNILKLKSGYSEQLSYELTPLDATNKQVTWSSDNEAVAKVDESGQITAVGKGKCMITVHATDGSGKTATCEVTVKK